MSGSIVWGSAPWGAIEAFAVGAPPAYQLADPTGPLFLAIEVEVFQPAIGAFNQGDPWGSIPWGALSATTLAAADVATLRVSDLGYVTKADDPPGLVVYAPILTSGVTLDRSMELPPDGQGAAAGWGSITLAGDGGALDGLATSQNADGRPIRVRLGRKVPQPHGALSDPAFAATSELFSAIGAGMTLTESELTIALRDPTYWLERPVDGAVYAGTGGLEGTSALAGKRKPRVRGGTSADPVREITPELVDPVAGIYQVSDGPGVVVNLWERGAATIANAGPVADITAVSPAAGTFRWEGSARGTFVRLGTFPPAGVLTVDATGAFPDGQAPTTPGGIALQLLLQDLGVPPSYLDAGAFAGLASAAPWAAGWSLAAGEAMDGAVLLGLFARSAAARIVPTRSGQLGIVSLTAIAPGTVPVASYTEAQIRNCTQIPLDAPLAPPPWRMRVGWGRFFTTQTTGLAPTLTGARVQALAEEWRVAVAAQTSVLAAWRRASDPPLIETALTNGANADSLAAALRDLWCLDAGRRLYAVELPLSFALRHDLGQPIVVSYPGPLRAGALCRIVGEQLRYADDAAILQVLT